jgi:hypothetical protein
MTTTTASRPTEVPATFRAAGLMVSARSKEVMVEEVTRPRRKAARILATTRNPGLPEGRLRKFQDKADTTPVTPPGRHHAIRHATTRQPLPANRRLQGVAAGHPRRRRPKTRSVRSVSWHRLTTPVRPASGHNNLNLKPKSRSRAARKPKHAKRGTKPTAEAAGGDVSRNRTEESADP